MHSTHLEQGGLFLSRKTRWILLLDQENNLALCKGRMWVFSRLVLQTSLAVNLYMIICAEVIAGCKHYLLPALECHWLLRLLLLKSWFSHSGWWLTCLVSDSIITKQIGTRIRVKYSRVDLWANRKNKGAKDQSILHSKNKKKMGRRKR